MTTTQISISNSFKEQEEFLNQISDCMKNNDVSPNEISSACLLAIANQLYINNNLLFHINQDKF
jgi:hypothetical protein